MRRTGNQKADDDDLQLLAINVINEVYGLTQTARTPLPKFWG
jgi:hypothetical protein